jgi:hypothetical protein
MKKNVALIGTSLALTACVNTSQVVPMGKDSYMITGQAHGGLNSGQSNVAAVEQANAYCTSLHRYMIVRRLDTSGVAAFGGETARLVFSCVTENDPEYQRPNLRPEPTTVIEDQRK